MPDFSRSKIIAWCFCVDSNEGEMKIIHGIIIVRHIIGKLGFVSGLNAMS